MAGNTISWPTLDRYNTHLYWHTNTQGLPNYREAGKPVFGARVELTCQTLAGWIPWYDLFQDDIQVNVQIGTLFLEMFAEQYGQEFDYQCLFANAAPFTGIFAATGAREHVVSGSTPMSINLEDLTNAPLKVPVQDRVNGIWIVSEDFVSWLAAHKNAIGDYAWMPPMEGQRPGMIAGKPYVEVPTMKSIHDVHESERFAWFGNPQDIWHGNRMGIELRTFRETEASLLNGEEFIRFRKRDGFKATRTDRSVFLKTAARS
jgi:HK97 family phage major capsid protein